MKNPNGPYPGRQLFVGLTKEERPAFAYLVTGRSPASRERKATEKENSIINGPIGNQPYHWLFHYTAVKYDNEIGLGIVTNGIQTEAIFETYKLLYHCGTAPVADYMKTIMDGANYEPDSLKTPRISGLVTNRKDNNNVNYVLSIKIADKPAFTWEVNPVAGTFYGVSTYHGNIENPGAYLADKGPAELKFSALTPQAIADFLYEISAENYKGEDIRVFAVGGVRTDNAWKVAFINRHKG
jgi:IMP cyclohydrolase